ncbi:hypothetical protein SEVIR_2G360000v4 [Setaria viridis]|uniref:F-box domain-containing protein n=1 Tax=Setaria viridis TaxID=4556 RepID=A0A4U6W1S7_SETVI|nr:uncharacterized protein LOC117842874 isoform X1 [Setaria viridis]TKW35243.1 hypothetical protein SEVIR_2G360000v2 [Setaria viridis]
MASPPPLLTLTDELLEEIFLRLPGPTDLARASTACASFHRVITDRAFLRRFRGIHPPPLLGFVPRGQDGFYPAQPPYHSAPLARAVADAADFSYYFVPIGRWLKPWRPRDLRQGRVLLECLPKYDERYHFHSVVFLSDLDLAVCDPLHRRYVLLPPVPHKITAQHGLLVDFDAFLAPTDQDEEGTSFQVICTARNETNLFAIVFSSVTGHWCIAASPSWSCLGTEVAFDKLAYPDYANGCFYWTQDWFGKLLMLDATKMEFSIVNSVPSSNLIEGNINSGIVTGAEGPPLMFFFGTHSEDDSSDLLHITKLDSSEPSGEQHLERIIPLARKYRYSICGAVEGFLFLHGFPEGQHSVRRRRHSWNVPNREYLLLDVKTSELKKVCEMKHDFFSVHAYFGFPRSLSKPCI